MEIKETSIMRLKKDLAVTIVGQNHSLTLTQGSNPAESHVSKVIQFVQLSSCKPDYCRMYITFPTPEILISFKKKQRLRDNCTASYMTPHLLMTTELDH